MRNYDAIYLSAHYDDAALSCGGLIHQQTEKGLSVLVVTLFGASPTTGTPLSYLAQRLHASMSDSSDITTIRQKEDRVAMNVLGADWHWMDFLSCIYRGSPQDDSWHYSRLEDMYHELHPNDVGLENTIAEALLEIVKGTEQPKLYAPLGVGNHVDHQLTHRAGKLLQQQGYSVAFYEDYPYADEAHTFSFLKGNPYSLQAAEAVMAQQNRTPHSIALHPQNVKARIHSICAYQSQLGGLSEDAVASYVQNFTTRNSPTQPAERIWGLTESP